MLLNVWWRRLLLGLRRGPEAMSLGFGRESQEGWGSDRSVGRLRTEANRTRQPFNERDAVLAWVALSSLRVVRLMRGARVDWSLWPGIVLV